jgi:copper(I)-binding protein
MIGHTLRTLALASLLCGPALASEIDVHDPWARATPPGASVAGGYLRLHNSGSADDRLVAVESSAAASVEIHSMSMDGGVMRMRRLDAGLPLPAGETVALEPGGLHLMFIRPTQPFAEGAQISATLRFERAGPQVVEFPVRAGAEDGHSHSHAH